ncbi:MAG: hypothetical protein JWN73_1303 [Betaproteobacteria bacterium]|nr:hypothetical protein [Betaproteobacteria bacterium]
MNPALDETLAGAAPAAPAPARETIETRKSWLIAVAVTFILAFSYGAPLVNTVALKSIAADFGGLRTVPSLAAAFVWLGSGIGAMAFGRLVPRLGYRFIALFGTVCIGLGLMLSSSGDSVRFLIGHVVFIGFLGSGAINAQMMVYISRWFDRRRGTALALVTSGQYIGGMVWPTLITTGLSEGGWRHTMFVSGIVVIAGLVPLVWFALRPPPAIDTAPSGAKSFSRQVSIAGQSQRKTFVMLCIAGFCCCMPMAMPPSHLVALCGDLGISGKTGAFMLSVMQACAFISRQFWGWLSDRMGGLKTILAGSILQALSIVGFSLTQSEFGLFAVASAFGMGFAGIIPAYVLGVREIFPAEEAHWRVPTWFFSNLCGMAFGSWLAGYIYDQTHTYSLAFNLGILFNVGNIAVIGWLVSRQVNR